jgi:NTP pyrophosphatase (non-canonical NTP hydrolase)
MSDTTLDQAAVHEWSVRNFGEIPQTLVTLGLAEEVGELCRAVLKRAQGIRGTREEWNEEIRKELGDCVIKLLDIAAYEGFDLVEVAAARWESVSKRNWVADSNGHGLPEATS